uniref:glycosyl hydrolase family 28 protein n=1 Tax=uncultured Draconibacterium sp. TaxID=1573823 RepID=UPI003216302A
MKAYKIILISALLLWSFSLTAKEYKASLFGTVSDGITLNTGSIQYAINHISENGGGRLVFYVGRYLTGSIQLKSNVTIELKEGAVLVAAPSVYDYDGPEDKNALIWADKQDNIGIVGKGVIEGQGTAVLESINRQLEKGYLKEDVAKTRPELIFMKGCNNITVDGLNLKDACGNVQSFDGCTGVDISNITTTSITVEGSNGILLSECDGVNLSDSFFDISGQELSLLTVSKNLSVENCINKSGKKIKVK